MKRHLQCAEQQVSRSNLTKYCTCHAESLAYLVLITYETSFRVRGATGVTIQPHQILRLPRKMTRLLYRSHIWNVISNARSNRCHYPTSPNTAPATKNDTARFQRKSPKTGETSFPMRGRSDHDPSMIREWKRKPQPASQVRLLCEVPRSIFYCKIQRFAPNLTVKLSPNTAPATKSDTTTSPSTAPATKSATWTSPSTAPATKNDSTALSSSHMKRHFQCAEQQVSLSNLAKYCACHEKWHCKMSKKIPKNRWNVISNAGPIRPWSDHDPSMIRAWSENENANRNPPRKWGYFARSPEAFSIVKYNVLHPILQSNFHQILRLPRKVTLQLHQVLRLLRKVPLERHHQVLHLPRKVTLELHQVVHLPRKVTLELHQVLRLPLHEVWRRLYLTLLDTTLLDSTLLDSTRHYSTWLYSTWLYSTRHYSTWLYSTWLYSTRHYSTWLYSTWLYSTRHYSTWLNTWLYSTWHYSTWNYSTWLYSTRHYSTWLNFTEMSFVYRKFLS